MQSDSATLENIDSLILQTEQFHVRSLEILEEIILGHRAPHFKASEQRITVGDAALELKIVQQRKQELLLKKKLVIQ